MIDFSLSDSQSALRNGAKQFAEQVLSTAPKLYADKKDQRERFEATLPIYQTAVQAGIIKGQVPVPLGGASASMVDAAIVVEEFFAVEPSASITVLGTGLGLTPLILAGNPEQHKKFLEPFLKQEGEPIAAFVHSEPGGTANWLEKGAPGLQTTAYYEEGGEWVVNGEKLWTTNSSGWDQRGADIQCVVCRHAKPNEPQDPNSDPVSNILILIITRDDVKDNDPKAYEVLGDPELAGFKSAIGPHSRFTNFRVPSSQLLAKPGTGAQVVEQTFGTSAALVGAMCVGIMRSAFESALKFCKSETRGGKSPIIDHQSVSDRLINMKMRVEAARSLVWKALWGVEQVMGGKGKWENALEVCLESKIWCSEEVTKVVLEGMAVVGMKSYAEDMPFGKMLENAACLPLFDGGNVGVRRRQLEKIFQADDYEPWAATYSS
ncbi:acyl-CoA dehydrogenase/oxidase [Lophiotrema nucula]|uniref:Acyl-CoA dehydrogenase/oxidase n=1 Tax=Lophiotrema nucula TaxID=690887 RepID=A0A6A5Z970_9PLEO|nr:acyl-CoA dehydrogenase/oxidase [Lophiotrema nucula]